MMVEVTCKYRVLKQRIAARLLLFQSLINNGLMINHKHQSQRQKIVRTIIVALKTRLKLKVYEVRLSLRHLEITQLVS